MLAKILIVEDDSITQELLKHLMAARGHSVWAVSDGGAAVAAAITHQPDLVLCDINLPTMNGLEVLNQIRANNSTSRIPVVALTAAGARSEDAIGGVRDRIIGMGFTGYISKPIDPKGFSQQIEAFLSAKVG